MSGLNSEFNLYEVTAHNPLQNNIDAPEHGQSSANRNLGAAYLDRNFSLLCPNIRGHERPEDYEQGTNEFPKNPNGQSLNVL
jgi:hypothetical protein